MFAGLLEELQQLVALILNGTYEGSVRTDFKSAVPAKARLAHNALTEAIPTTLSRFAREGTW